MRRVIPLGSTHPFLDAKARGSEMTFAVTEPVLSSRGRKVQVHFARRLAVNTHQINNGIE